MARDGEGLVPRYTMIHVTYPNVCGKHKWQGEGECPSCAGERAADEAIEQAGIDEIERDPVPEKNSFPPCCTHG